MNTSHTSSNGSKNKPGKRLPMPSGLTLQEHIDNFKRHDGSTGLRVRELMRATHVSAETLRHAVPNPARFSLASLHGLAGLIGIDFLQLLADISQQVKLQPFFDDPSTGRGPHVRIRNSRNDIAIAPELNFCSDDVAESCMTARALAAEQVCELLPDHPKDVGAGCVEPPQEPAYQDLLSENQRLEHELAILKKALVICSRDTLLQSI